MLKFAEILRSLRTKAGLTNDELAELANVPRSLVPGLQSGKRRIGECQARRLAFALDLTGADLDRFVFSAINACTEKVLQESKSYPAECLNLLPRQLRLAGVFPDHLCVTQVSEHPFTSQLFLRLADGRVAKIETRLAMEDT